MFSMYSAYQLRLVPSKILCKNVLSTPFSGNSRCCLKSDVRRQTFINCNVLCNKRIS